MATIEKTPTGWRVRVRKAGVSKSTTVRTKGEAQAWAAEHEHEAVKVKRGGLPKKTVGDLFERYREEVTPKKPGARWELLRLKLLEGKWERSDRLLTDITANDVLALQNKRAEAIAPASVVREMTIIKAMFSTAIKPWGWLHENPVKGVKPPAEPPPRIRRISPAEIDAILVAAGYDDCAPVVTPMAEVMVAFLFAIESAMRSGEILAITRKTYDVARKVVYVPTSKTGAARTVPLSKRAVELLDKLPGNGDQLFSISDESRDTLFRKARDRSGVEDLHFHDTRREGTSRLAKKVDVLTLARITGHKDLKMLLIYYQTDMEEVAAQLG